MSLLQAVHTACATHTNSRQRPGLTSCLKFMAAAVGEAEVPLEWNSGSNGYVYWVSNYLGGPLTQLPHVTPAQVRQQQQHTTAKVCASADEKLVPVLHPMTCEDELCSQMMPCRASPSRSLCSHDHLLFTQS